MMIVYLVTATLFINYIDRGNLGTVSPVIADALHLSASQIGILGSAFYFGYVPFMPATGWLAERYGARVVLAAGVTLWSLATLAMGFAGSFAALLALRILLGVGESVAFPCASKILASTVPVNRLGTANGIMSFGYLLGPAVGTFIGGMLMVAYGWRSTFWVLGTLSLLWLWPWWRTKVADERQNETRTTVSPPAFSEVLRQRGLWGASFGHFASNYVYYFILLWLPFYLVKSRGFSIESMTLIASSAYLVNAGSALAAGWATDRWIKAGHSTTVIYKSLMAVTHIVGFGCMFGMLLLPEKGCVAALFVFALVAGTSYPGIFAIPQILAGPQATGRWVGVQNAVANVAGFAAPAITGFLIDWTGRFDLAFVAAALVNILGLIGWVLMVPKIAPLRWQPAGT